MPRLLCLSLCVFLCLWCAEGTWAQRDALQRALPCPAPEDIAPCICTVFPDNISMDMDCSNVEGEDQLARIFSAYLPSANFFTLNIEGNQNIKRLRKGDLGPASFEAIWISYSALESIEPGALSGSSATAREFYLPHNAIVEFPFEELPLFTSLYSLDLGYNALQSFPTLSSESLETVDLSSNNFTEVPLDGFSDVRNALLVSLYGTNLKEITPGTFSELANLYDLQLAKNELSHIQTGAITLGGRNKGYVSLYFNNISRIDAGGITGLGNGYLEIWRNSLKEFPEDVFRPILEGGADVILYGNPLDCGCDIAWLISNETFMGQIASDPPASCYDGRLLADLDPAIYDDMCSH